MLINEAVASQMPSRCYCMADQNLTVFFCIYNSLNFDKSTNNTDRNAAPKCNRALQKPVSTNCCTSLLISSVHAEDDLNHKFHNLDSSLHNTCCHWFSVQILNNLAYLSPFSPVSSPLIMVSWQSVFYWDRIWWGFSKPQMDQIKGEMYAGFNGLNKNKKRVAVIYKHWTKKFSERPADVQRDILKDHQ